KLGAAAGPRAPRLGEWGPLGDPPAQPPRHPETGEIEHVAAQRREKGGNVASLEMRGETHCTAILGRRPIDVRTMRDKELNNIDGIPGNGVVQSALLGRVGDIDVHAELK